MKIQEIPRARLLALQAGQVESRTLTESLAVDLSALLSQSISAIPKKDLGLLAEQSTQGITKRMSLAGSILLKTVGVEKLPILAHHKADMIRGMACYMLAAQPNLSLIALLEQIKPLANDSHFGVREWAWLAIRPQISQQIELAIDYLLRWCDAPSPYLRRFASEVTRPRGVWCTHISKLKTNPELALPLLEALKGDTHPYVQVAVGNWLNDASKTQPDWVRGVVARWEADAARPTSSRVCKLALRTLSKRI